MSEPEIPVPQGYKFYIRRFLNKPGFHTMASVLATVDNEGYANLEISDCSRVVTLSIESRNQRKADRENCLFKLKLLEETIKKFRLAIEKNYKGASDE